MTNKSYNSNYIKIYFWQGAAFVLRFLSMFIVMPYLTKDKSTYGIYAVCISVTIFLNYADLGFLRASQKFAAEYYVRSERENEMKQIGFVTFVLLIFTLLCSSFFIYIGYNPQVLIKDLDTPDKIYTASSLLFILAGFAPVTTLNRMVSLIFEIRLESYINQRISLCASIITIGSVFYFFENGNYQIVQYFLFSQSVNFIFVVIYLGIAKKKYNYNIKALFKCIRFDAAVYKKAKGIAYSGLYGLVAWILLYELDQIVISKYLGAEKVAIYAIAFVFITLFRSIYSILFAPLMVRANYFVGNGDDEGLKRFCLQMVSLSAPFVVLPTVAFVLVAKPFIMTWVGEQYIDSIDLARLFALIYTLSFIGYTSSIILIAKERIREMNVLAIIMPLIFWIGIMSTYSFLGLLSFAVFKFITIIISQLFYLFIFIRFLDISLKDFFLKIIYPLLVPLLFLVIALVFANNYMRYEKSKQNLFIVIVTTASCIVLSFFIQYLTSSTIRLFAKKLIGNLFKK